MKRETGPDALATFQRLMMAAETFLNRAPKAKRIEAERTALADAIADAQLMLSVRRLPPPPKPPKAKAVTEDVGRLKGDLKTARRRIADLERDLHALKDHLETVLESANKAESLLDKAFGTSRDEDATA